MRYIGQLREKMPDFACALVRDVPNSHSIEGVPEVLMAHEGAEAAHEALRLPLFQTCDDTLFIYSLAYLGGNVARGILEGMLT